MRQTVTQAIIDQTILQIQNQLQKSLNKHGLGLPFSYHEVLGAITEEYQELIEAIRDGDSDNVESEMADVAVAAIWGLLAFAQNRLDATSKKQE